MEAPRGVEVSAAKGPLKVSGRKDLQLESTEGEVSQSGRVQATSGTIPGLYLFVSPVIKKRSRLDFCWVPKVSSVLGLQMVMKCGELKF